MLGDRVMVFGAFSKMIAKLPPEAIVKAVDLQCKTIQDDLTYDRFTVEEDVFSILCFGQFVNTTNNGKAFGCIRSLPLDHLEFYRETIDRLVQAHELPASAMEQFDRAFATF
jgi:hypothetical protein